MVTYENPTLEVERPTLLQHCSSFTGLLYPTGSFTPAVRSEERWKLICKNPLAVCRRFENALFSSSGKNDTVLQYEETRYAVSNALGNVPVLYAATQTP